MKRGESSNGVRLACWENGVGYDAGERFAMFCVC